MIVDQRLSAQVVGGLVGKWSVVSICQIWDIPFPISQIACK